MIMIQNSRECSAILYVCELKLKHFWNSLVYTKTAVQGLGQNLNSNFNFFFGFSSPDPKAHMSFSDCNLSVVSHCIVVVVGNISQFHLLLQSPWVIQVCSSKRPCLPQRGDN